MIRVLVLCCIPILALPAYASEYTNPQLECIVTTADSNPNIQVEEKEGCTYINCFGFGVFSETDAVEACKNTINRLASSSMGVCGLDRKEFYSAEKFKVKGERYSVLFKQCKI